MSVRPDENAPAIGLDAVEDDPRGLCIFGTYNGAMIPFLTEMMPPLVRTASFSLAFSCATAIFGGMTPAVCTFLIHATGNPAMPGAWLTVPALFALVSALLTRPYREAAPPRAAAAPA